MHPIHVYSRLRLEDSQEDFFYRAMRERESEVKKMNESVHKVNNIYEVG